MPRHGQEPVCRSEFYDFVKNWVIKIISINWT